MKRLIPLILCDIYKIENVFLTEKTSLIDQHTNSKFQESHSCWIFLDIKGLSIENVQAYTQPKIYEISNIC